MTIVHSPTVPTGITTHAPHNADITEKTSNHATGCAALLRGFSQRIGVERYARYFEQAARIERSGDALHVLVQSTFDAEWLRRSFGSDLKAAALESVGKLDVRWIVEPDAFAAATVDEAPPVPAPHPASTARRPAAPSSRQPAPSRRGPRYRLDDLITGEANRLALMASERFVDDVDIEQGLSQLFLHGGCGVGKTHIINGIATRFRDVHPEARIACVTSEMFANEFIAAVQAKRLEAFRKRYRGLDLLCVDDVQFLQGKDKTQSELLHTIEALDRERGRIVLTADEHPKRLDRLCKRLVSRCVSGMVAKLDAPERPLRARLAERFAAHRALVLEDAAAGVIADLCAGSVREIEGAIVRLEAFARLERTTAPLSAALARRVLGAAGVARLRKPISVHLVSRVVCAELGVDLSEVLGRGRHRLIVLARSMAALLSRDLTTMSYPEIARALNRKNHSTVVTACQRVRRQMEEGREQDAGPQQGVMPLSDLYARLRDVIERAASSGEVASVA